jgi:competence protein ComEC
MARLPRAAWLACGAIIAALLADVVAGTGGRWLLLGIGLGVLALVATGVLAFKGRAAAAVLCLAFGSVALRAGIAALLVGSPSATQPPSGTSTWTGRVADISSPSGMEQRAFVALSDPARAGPDWLAYTWLPRHPPLTRGDVLELDGAFEPAPTDGGGFSGFLAARGAVGTLRAHDVRLVSHGSDAMAAVEQLRAGIDASLASVLPEPEAGLASGILVGLRERVSREVSDDFTATGLTHVVAISGWNIALVAGIATGLLRAVGLGRRSRSFLVMAAIAAYTVVAGAEASVVRAAVMGGVVILAREGGHPAGAAAALGLACWGLLLVDPGMIGDIGLQLSMAATAGLLALGAASERLVDGATRGRTPRWFNETLGVSLAAQLATLPLILGHFGRLSVISPLANLVIGPVVPFAMLGAAISAVRGTLADLLPTLLMAPVDLAAWLPLAAMTRIGDVLAGVPFASVALSPPFGLAGAIAALVALLAVLSKARPHHSSAVRVRPPFVSVRASSRGRASRIRRLGAVGIAGAIVGIGLVSLVAQARPSLRLTVLDIGQGDAILLESSNGGRVLVDGGPDPDLLVRRLDERIPIWDRRIDLVVLTHPHEDHAGGLGGLVPRYRVGRIAETGMASRGAGTRALREAASRLGISRVRLTQGDGFRLGDTQVDVLWPPLEGLPSVAPSTGRAINDTSIVLALEIGTQRALLTGDLEADRDADLLAVIGDDGRPWDFLKVAHHGSAGASSTALLGRLRPRAATISAGVDNDYGHPAPETLARLEAVGARIWRTDLQGSGAVDFDGGPTDLGGVWTSRAMTCPPRWSRRPSGASGRDACYARADGGAHPSRGALLAAVHGSIPATPAAPHGRGRGRCIPGRSGRTSRPHGRPPPRRGSRAPPRCRQGAARGPSRQSARPRPSRRQVAQRCRSPGARASGRRPSRHVPRRRGGRHVGHRWTHRGAHRLLRRQARHAARGLHGAPLRALAKATP